MLELLVVILIIGVLLTIAIGLMLDMRERAYVSSLEADLNAAYKASLEFHNNESGAVATLNDLRDYGYRQSQYIDVAIVDGTEEHLLITATHPGVSGVYQVDEDGRISEQ